MSDIRTALTRGFATAVLSVVVLCARADATPAKVEQVMTVGCRIQVTDEGGGIRIEAVANSRAKVSGRYRLDIRKASASGASHNIQSGDFNLDANKEEILSTTFLGASDAGHFQARLELDSDSGSVSCVSP